MSWSYLCDGIGMGGQRGQNISCPLWSIAIGTRHCAKLFTNVFSLNPKPDRIPSSSFYVMSRLKLRKISNFPKVTELISGWSGVSIHGVWPLDWGPDHVQDIKLCVLQIRSPVPFATLQGKYDPHCTDKTTKAPTIKYQPQGHAQGSSRADVQHCVCRVFRSGISLSAIGAHSKQTWEILLLP